MALDDSYSKVLLHFEGADASTTFTDESGKTWTASGGGQIDTAQYKFGSASLLLDGDGDYIQTSDSDDFAFGSGDFTIDCWIRFSAYSSSDRYAIYGQNYYGVYYIIFEIVNGRLSISEAGGTGVSNTTAEIAWNSNQWYHVALVRNGSSLTLYIDGVAQNIDTGFYYTAFNNGSLPNLDAPVQLGGFGSGRYFKGWIDEARVSKGIARWTANFTPPTSAYGETPPATNRRMCACFI